jgi:hypothetical protein
VVQAVPLRTTLGCPVTTSDDGYAGGVRAGLTKELAIAGRSTSPIVQHWPWHDWANCSRSGTERLRFGRSAV